MKSKDSCQGCCYNYRNSYNWGGELDPNAECVFYANMRIESRKRVRLDEPPPWEGAIESLPSCYHQEGFIFVEPNKTC